MHVNWNLVSLNYRSQTLQTRKVLQWIQRTHRMAMQMTISKWPNRDRIRRPGGKNDSLPQALLSALSTQLGSFHFSWGPARMSPGCPGCPCFYVNRNLCNLVMSDVLYLWPAWDSSAWALCNSSALWANCFFNFASLRHCESVSLNDEFLWISGTKRLKHHFSHVFSL